MVDEKKNESLIIKIENMDNLTIDKLITEFESNAYKTEDGTEFWYARDLQRLLEYEVWDRFNDVIQKAIATCKNVGIPVEMHFQEVFSRAGKNSEGGRPSKDYRLTRPACYLVAQNALSNKKPVSFAQAYFTIQTRRQELEDEQRKKELTSDEERVYLRNQLKEHNKILMGVAKEAGVRDGVDYAIFTNEGYKGLYGGLDKKGIQSIKGLRKTDNISDHMGNEELGANLFRATQAEAKLKRDNIKNKEFANQAHLEVGREVRKTIKKIGGTMPEHLPAVENVRKVESRLKKEKKLQRKIKK